MRLSQQDLARAIRVPYQRVNELINQRRARAAEANAIRKIRPVRAAG